MLFISKEYAAHFVAEGSRVAYASDALLCQVATLHYLGSNGSPLSKTAIAKELGLSQMQVARLLEEAHRRNFISIAIEPVRRDLDARAQEILHLNKVISVPFEPDYEKQKPLLGKAAAAFFDDLLDRRGSLKVCVGSGSTIHEFISALPVRTRKVVFCPLALITRTAEGELYDSPFLTIHARWKSPSGSRAISCALPPLPHKMDSAKKFTRLLLSMNEELVRVLEESAKSSVVFMNVRAFDEEQAVLDAYERVGISRELLAQAGAVGDVGFSIFDRQGTDLSRKLFEEEKMIQNPHCHPFLPALSLGRIREIARVEDSEVVLVAGGKHKIEAIQAAVESGMVTTLISDSWSVEELIARSVSRASPPAGKKRLRVLRGK